MLLIPLPLSQTVTPSRTPLERDVLYGRPLNKIFISLILLEKPLYRGRVTVAALLRAIVFVIKMTQTFINRSEASELSVNIYVLNTLTVHFPEFPGVSFLMVTVVFLLLNHDHTRSAVFSFDVA